MYPSTTLLSEWYMTEHVGKTISRLISSAISTARTVAHNSSRGTVVAWVGASFAFPNANDTVIVPVLSTGFR